MLFLVGTGMSYDDISVRALEICKGCTLYIEKYTSLVDDQKIERLSKLAGKSISVLSREDLEDRASATVSMAKGKDIAILVGGDPLTATTHKILMIEARKQGIKVKVLHSSSAIPAIIGESGLDFYRFGQICTIPRWTDRYKPVSFYETIDRNLSANLHSLVLLDYYPENRSTLPTAEAVKELEAAEASYKKGIIAGATKMFLMQDIGLDSQKITVTDIGAARNMQGSGMAAIIFPARMSAIEEETVKSVTG
jgi:diphthine synthase